MKNFTAFGKSVNCMKFLIVKEWAFFKAGANLYLFLEKRTK